MSSSSHISTYQSYKKDTDTVATFLVTIAKDHGYSQPLKSEKGTSGSKRLKGKARKEAKEAKEATNKEAPNYVISIDEFVTLAEWIASSTKRDTTLPGEFSSALSRAIKARKQQQQWHQGDQKGESEHDKEADTKHDYFIGILEKVQETLRPFMPSQRKRQQFAESKGDRQSAGGQMSLSNQFEGLKVEEPSTAWQASGPAEVKQPSIKYTLEQEPDEQEAWFAVCCLFEDLGTIRICVKNIWEQYREGRRSLETAAVTTNTALSLAHSFEREYLAEFNAWSDWKRTLGIFQAKLCMAADVDGQAREKAGDPFNFAVYDEVEQVLLPAWGLMNVFLYYVEQNYLPEKEEDRFNAIRNSKEREKLSPREKFQDDKWVLDKLVPNILHYVIEMDRAESEDELLLGMREMVASKKLTLSTTLASQIFLDIHHILGNQVANGFSELEKGAKEMRSSIKYGLSLHSPSMSTICQSTQSNPKEDFQEVLAMFDDWVDTDVVEECREIVAKNHGRPCSSQESFLLLKHHPMWCGLLSFTMKSLNYHAGIKLANGWLAFSACAHLYNALKQEGLISGNWEDIEAALAAYGSNHILVGTPPKNPRDYYFRFYLAIGVSIGTFAKNKRRPPTETFLRAPALEWSKKGPRVLESICKLSGRLNSRLCGYEDGTVLSPNDLESILIKCGHLQEHGTTSGSTDPSAKMASQRDKDVSLAHLLQSFADGVESELSWLEYDPLQLHSICWELLRDVERELSENLRSLYNIQTPLREQDLPFLVGSIFESFIPAGTTLIGRSGQKQESLVTRSLIQGAAEPVKRIIESGKGDVLASRQKKKSLSLLKARGQLLDESTSAETKESTTKEESSEL